MDFFSRNNNASRGIIPRIEVNSTFTKKGYENLLQKKRREYIQKCIGEETIRLIFTDLQKMAEKLLPCDYRTKVEAPEHIDLERLSTIINNYFGFLGYTCQTEIREGKIDLHLS